MPAAVQKGLLVLLLFAVIAVDFTSKVMSIAFDAAFVVCILVILKSWFWDSGKT